MMHNAKCTSMHKQRQWWFDAGTIRPVRAQRASLCLSLWEFNLFYSSTERKVSELTFTFLIVGPKLPSFHSLSFRNTVGLCTNPYVIKVLSVHDNSYKKLPGYYFTTLSLQNVLICSSEKCTLAHLCS